MAKPNGGACVTVRRRPIPAVRALRPDLGGALAHLIVDAQQHAAEWTGAPAALRLIDWQGCVLTGDALECQQALCAQVVEAGGDDRLRVQDNQPTVLADIQPVVQPLTADELARSGVPTVIPMAIQTHRTIAKGHGRIEARVIRVSSELAG